MELTIKILEQAVPQHLQMVVNPILPWFDDWIRQLLYTPEHEVLWKILSNLMLISKHTRKLALSIFKSTSCMNFAIAVPWAWNLIDSPRKRNVNIKYPGWLCDFGPAQLHLQRKAQFSPRRKGRSTVRQWKHDSHLSTLYVTVSIPIVGPGEQLKPPKLVWHIARGKPSEVELIEFSKYMADFESLLTAGHKEFIDSEAPMWKSGQRAEYVCLTAIHFSYGSPSVLDENRRIISQAHDYEPGTKDMEEIDRANMGRLADDIGRRNMLEVLWVFMPYLQPDGDIWEWMSCKQSNAEGVDITSDRLMMVLLEGSLSSMFAVTEEDGVD